MKSKFYFKNKWLFSLAVLTTVLLSCTTAFGQTQLISASDGGFENATSTFAANGWSTALGGTARNWMVGTIASSVAGGTKSAYVGSATAYNGIAGATSTHIYRDVAIPAGATNVQLSFYLREPTIDNTFDYLNVYTTTTSNTPVGGTTPGSGFTLQYSNTATAYTGFTLLPSINLTSYAGTTVRIVFTFISDGVTPNANPAIDNVTVSYTPGGNCSGTPNPGTITAPSSACSGVPFTITSSSLSTGTGITYQWQSAATCAGSFTNITGQTGTSLTTSLSSATAYRLVTTCSFSGLTNTSNCASVGLNSNTCTCISYCAPVYGSWDGTDYIANVSLNSWSNPSGAPSSAATSYTNFTGLSTTTLTIGNPYTLTVTSGTYCCDTYSAYIDFNNNGVFTDAGELIGSTVNSVAGSSFSYAFTVPTGATVGNHRMRIVCSTAGVVSCNTTGYGETEDYCITLAAAVGCSGQPNVGTISGPASACASSSFTISSSGLSTGSGISYQWQSASSCAGSFTNIAGQTLSTLTTSLTSATAYRVVTTCSNSGLTNTSNCISVALNSNTCACLSYCATSATTCDEAINSFTFNSISNLNTGCSGGYADYTGFSTSVTAGNSYSVSINTTLYYAGDQAFVWIDYNQNGVFDGSERTTLTYTGTGGLFTGTVNIPSGATPGSTRLRARMEYTTDFGACGAADFGETEDYCVTISVPAACSGTPAPGNTTMTSGTNPTCSGSPFTLGLQNLTSGTGVTYQWQSAPDVSGSPGTYSNISGATSSTYTGTQSAITWYRCAVTCGSVGGGTGFSNDLRITMQACYCAPSSDCTPDRINRVNINSGTYDNSGNGCSSGGYSLWNAIIPNMAQSTSNSDVAVTARENAIGGGTVVLAVWIDWNQDGTFSASENVYLSLPYTYPIALTAQTVTTGTIPISVPSNAVLGNTRMRTRVALTSSMTANDACTVYATGETEDYIINITPAPVCTTPPTVGTISGPTTATVGDILSYSVSTFSATTINWQFSAASSSGPFSDISGATTNPSSITPNTAGTYYIRLRVSSPGCADVFSNVITLVVSPFNVCTAAIPVACGSTTTGSTVGSSTANLPPVCNGYTPNPGRWYSVTPTASGTMTVSLCGSAYDTYLHVYTNCSALNCVTANDDFCGLQSEASFSAVGGTTYYIFVNGFSSATGNFTMTVTCPCTSLAQGGSVSGATSGCINSSLGSITETGGTGSYQWQVNINSAGFSDISGATSATLSGYTPTSSGSYEFRCKRSTSCDVQYSVTTLTVTVNPLPSVTAAASPTAVCPGDLVSLNGSGGLPSGYVMSTGSSCFVNISSSGTSLGIFGDDDEYSITLPFAFNFNGTSYSTALVGSNGALVFGSSSGDIDFTNSCLPASFGTAGSAGIAAWWDDLYPAVDGSSNILTQLIGSTFYIQWQNVAHIDNGGSNGATFQIQLNQSTGVIRLAYLDVNVGGNGLNAGGSATAGLNFGSTASQFSCSTQNLTAGLCITYTPSFAAQSYLWSSTPSSLITNSTSPNATANPTVATTYTLTITSGGCTSSSTTVQVTMNSAPVTIASTGNNICGNGSPVTLSSNFDGPYATYSGNGVSGNTFNPAAVGVVVGNNPVTVTYNPPTGCSGTATMNINVLALPNATATVSGANPRCRDLATGLSATGGGTYSWTGPLGFTSSVATPVISAVNANPAHSGLYTVTVTGTNGCTAQTSTNVTWWEKPTVAASTTNSPVCEGNTINLVGGVNWNGETPSSTPFQWLDADGNFFAGNNTQNPSFGPIDKELAGEWTFKATTNHGCFRTSTVQVDVLAAPYFTSGPAANSLAASGHNDPGMCSKANVTYPPVDANALLYHLYNYDFDAEAVLDDDHEDYPVALTYNFSNATTGSGNGDGNGSTFNVGTTNVVVTAATDISGCTSTLPFNVVINDSEAPVIWNPAHNRTAECDGNGNLAEFNDWLITNWGDADATDNCTDQATLDLYWTNNYQPSHWVHTCGNGQYVDVTFYVHDRAGNTSLPTTARFTIVDTQPPVITQTCGATSALGCNPSSEAISLALGTATAMDVCQGALMPVPTDGPVVQTSYCGRSQTRTWNVSDACGNAATAVSCTVTWIEDLSTPEIELHGGIADLGCNPSEADVLFYLGYATISSNAVVPSECIHTYLETFTDDSVSAGGCRWSRTRRFHAVNTCSGQDSWASFTTYWTLDHIAPTVAAIAPVTVSCIAEVPAANDAIVSATDNCANSVDLTVTHDADVITPGTCPNRYSISRTYHVEDLCGNSSSVTQTITVNDQTAPTLVGCPSNAVISACTPTYTWTEPTATDNCVSGATVTRSGPAPGSTFANGTTTTITYTAADACGNSSSCSFTVTRKATLAGTTSAVVRSCGYNVSCNGASDGVIGTSVSGGQTPYQYSWSPSGQTGATASGLAAGAYVVTVTDADGCTFTMTRTLTQPAVLTCNAGPNEQTYFGYTADQAFTHTATVAGGCGPYTYSWTFTRLTGASLTPMPASTGGLRCNNITSSGDEIFNVLGSGLTYANPYWTCNGNSTTNYIAPAYPTVSGVGASSINLMLMDTARVSLTVSDANGCSTQCSFVVYAEDARCWAGNSSIQKVTICHRSGNNTCATICVDSSAVAAHLAHGDAVGQCPRSGCPTGGKLDENATNMDAASYLTAYPNPFNEKTTIAFSVPKDGRAIIRIYDALGKEIGVVFDGMAKSGQMYKVEFDGSKYAEGMYFYSITSDDMNQTKRMNLIK